MKDNTDFMRIIRERMQDAIDNDRENRDESLDDFENLIGVGQWPDEIRREREEDGRPCLTINRLPQFVRQVTGDIRRMNPAIKVLPGDNESSQETAEIIEGLTRQIQTESDASSVYEWAAECAAACGIGWFRIITDWSDDASFTQEIRLEPIKNPLAVYFDPVSEKTTREDAQYLFITSKMRIAEFEGQYPGFSVVDAEHDAQVEGISNWYNQDTVVVAEYYWKEPVEKTIHLLVDGRTVEELPQGMTAVRSRKVQSHKVMWAKVSGKDVLEGPTEIPSRYIPVVCVPGEEWMVGDRVYRSSVIRFAKDPQRLYNYWRSAQTELVALQPKAPFLVTAKQVAGLETYWNEANNSNRPYLPYNPDEKAANPPARSQPPVASQGMMQEVLTAADDMQATTGIYDASLGQRSNETSGVAIRQRQMEADVGTSIYSDNMAKAVELAGRIIVDMIPRVYDTQRTIRILGLDDQEKMETINAIFMTQDGPVKVNDLTVGKYAVKISVGPNYSTMRQEAAESMIAFVQAFPQAAPVVGDLIAKNMDWPQADQFAERLKALLPPGIVPAEEMTPEQQQQMQGQMQAQQQQMAFQEQMMQAELAMKQTEAEVKRAEVQIKAQEAQGKQVEAQTRAQLDAQKIQLDKMKLELEAMKIAAERERLGLDAQRMNFERENQAAEIQLKRDGKGAAPVISYGMQDADKLGQELGKVLVEAMTQLSEQIQNGNEATMQGQVQLGQALGEVITQGNERVIGAITAPKELVRDESGRAVGVRVKNGG
jgi:hypothetical protein